MDQFHALVPALFRLNLFGNPATPVLYPSCHLWWWEDDKTSKAFPPLVPD
jgi:hypothetical protein